MLRCGQIALRATESFSSKLAPVRDAVSAALISGNGCARRDLAGELAGMYTAALGEYDEMGQRYEKGRAQVAHAACGTCQLLAMRPHHSLLTPHSTLHPPSPLAPHSSLLTPHSSLRTPRSSLLTPHSTLRIPHSSHLTPRHHLLSPLPRPLARRHVGRSWV